MAGSDFWDDRKAALAVIDELKGIQAWTEPLGKLERQVEDLRVAAELLEQEPDEDLAAETARRLDALEAEFDVLEFRSMLSGKDDRKDAILTIRSGAGGIDSQDWAGMLTDMYIRWAEKMDFEVEMLDSQPGEEAGIKSATFLAEGEYAFGFLKAESGVHRLVRISPFDSAARRHTSFASVFVYPEISDDIDVAIEEKDIRVDTFCASGPGGQGVNTTYSAVRITHFPTGIVVQCQNERSQIRNKEVAMKVLRARLFELEMEKKRAEIAERENAKKDIAWGSQIRSYTLQPYRLVKDHRTKVEIGNVDSVLDGNLDELIKAYLVQFREK